MIKIFKLRWQFQHERGSHYQRKWKYHYIEIVFYFYVCRNQYKYNYFGLVNLTNNYHMDSRIYFHQHRRPRYDNPTYSSSNVGNSMTYFNARQTSPGNSQSNYNRSNPNNYSLDNGIRSNNKPLQNSGNQEFQYNYGINVNANNNSNNYNIDRGNYNMNSNRGGISNLSNYGTNSLSFSQKDVYNKQNSKFDIISLRPKEFQNTIKQYPKYSLENKDEVYYQRMAQQYKQRKMYADKAQMPKNSNKPEFIAGKHTYSDQRRMPNNSQQNPQKQKYFSPKMLNHMDELTHLS